ncbi:MAG TPA: maleylpyruvate isomerase N-terminal domain-containing protein, partial [Acidimicrobiales bacterium]|nr:maleylpyruvate isomerase N-terminal domain-containing protein [Acidimicrobiales bacterium]
MVEHDPKPWISALRASHDRLASLVAPLDADGVNRASMADEWTIAQVLSHLGSQAEIFGTILDAGLAQSDPPSPDGFPAVWDAWNSRSARDQVADSVAANDAFVRKVEGLSRQQLDAVKVPMFGMDLDATRILQMRLSEHALHTWDVA